MLHDCQFCLQELFWIKIVYFQKLRLKIGSNTFQDTLSSALSLRFASNRLLFRHRYRLLPNADSQRLHLAIEVAALQAEQLGGAADIVAGFLNFLQNELAFVGVAGLL